MAQRRTLSLSTEERRALVELRNETKQEYIRERCAALLKIAEGESAHRVARQGLLRPRDPDTVYEWLDRSAAEGIAGVTTHQQGSVRRGSL